MLAAIPTMTYAKPEAKPDSDMKKVLDELALKGGKPIETLSATEARKQPTPADAVKSLMSKGQEKKTDKGFAKVEDRNISGAAGEISARFYTPDGKLPMPVVVYYHGGGWVIADKNVYDGSARAIALQSKAIVVSVDYREAPESKFPAAHDDAFAAYQWVLKNAASFGGDPKKIAVAGESAGGNLAINVAISARDKGAQAPTHVLAVYPVASSAMNTPSYIDNKDAKPLNAPMMTWFMKNYLNNMGEAKDPRINLVGANLKGLPETTIITAQIDPLMSEGKELADKMIAAGVKVNYKNYEGVTHEFFGMAPIVGDAKDAQKWGTGELKKTF
ncbi:MAG: alpha/beta hydrolase [Bdellovibrionaceae bacterium]|nr:alpha/beta hydrolase [Pseudobdellovibrionaceae bacterium]